MNPRIEVLAEKKLVGKRMIMSLANNKTAELWRSFMGRRQEIQNQIGTDLYSVQLYDPSYFSNFDPNTEFEKWAATEVGPTGHVPNEMETLQLPTGLYAVFLHKGGVGEGPATFYYIFGTWLPTSEYVLDYRPHFEVLDERYKNGDPSSEEELWIPIKPR